MMLRDEPLEWIKSYISQLPKPDIVILEAGWRIHTLYMRRRKKYKRFMTHLLFESGFIFNFEDKNIWYSAVYGFSQSIDTLGSILSNYKPEAVILIGYAYTDTIIQDASVITPLSAYIEALDIVGKADQGLLNALSRSLREEGFGVKPSNNHISKLSLTYRYSEASLDGATIDLETGPIYYLSNMNYVSAAALLQILPYPEIDPTTVTQEMVRERDKLFNTTLEKLTYEIFKY